MRKLLAMFGLIKADSKSQPDALTVEVLNATQRNERAGLAAKQVLEDMLARNDGLRGLRK